MKFIAEVLAPDGGSDSLHVGIKDKGSAQTWHLGPGRLWMEPWIRGSTKRTFYVSRNVSLQRCPLFLVCIYCSF